MCTHLHTYIGTYDRHMYITHIYVHKYNTKPQIYAYLHAQKYFSNEENTKVQSIGNIPIGTQWEHECTGTLCDVITQQNQ